LRKFFESLDCRLDVFGVRSFEARPFAGAGGDFEAQGVQRGADNRMPQTRKAYPYLTGSAAFRGSEAPADSPPAEFSTRKRVTDFLPRYLSMTVLWRLSPFTGSGAQQTVSSQFGVPFWRTVNDGGAGFFYGPRLEGHGQATENAFALKTAPASYHITKNYIFSRKAPKLVYGMLLVRLSKDL
jgi:hypothetical protein